MTITPQMEKLLDEFIERALQEDIGSGDHTSLACIPAKARNRAKLLLKDPGIIAGVEVARRIFQESRYPSRVYRAYQRW